MLYVSLSRHKVSTCNFRHRNIFSEFTLRPDFTSKLIRELAFGTPKFYIAPYDKMNHGLVNMSSNYDVKSGLKVIFKDVP